MFWTYKSAAIFSLHKFHFVVFHFTENFFATQETLWPKVIHWQHGGRWMGKKVKVHYMRV